MGDVKIKGVFMGQEIDLTICESESVPDQPSVPDEAPADVPPAEAPAADAEAPVEADPAPPVNPASDEPKNPTGNSEQL